MKGNQKVGILTFHCADNFGAVLQCYSLQRIISQLGYESKIIDFRPSAIVSPYSVIQNPFRIVKSGVLGVIKAIGGNICYFNKRVLRKNLYAAFRKAHLNITEQTYLDIREFFNKEGREYTHCVVGSDQVWNTNMLGQDASAYFLGCDVGKCRRVAYAASLGEAVSSGDQTLFKKSIPLFDFLSVREKSARGFVQQHSARPVAVVLDPTLLLSTEEWRKVAVTPKIDKYVFVYDLWINHVVIDVVSFIAKELGLKVVSYQNKKSYSSGHADYSYAGPADFLGLLMNAEFVVTSSFHGTTLAISNKKKFVTIPHPTRGARMVDLIDTLGLNSRLVRSVSDLARINLREPIDYSGTDKLLDIERERSLDYLKTALQ